MRVEPRFVGRMVLEAMGPPGAACDEYRLTQDFGFLRADNLLAIMPATAKINGASIPPPAWLIIGHPMAGENKYWSAPHDCGYRGTLMIVNMDTVPDGISALDVLQGWEYMGWSIEYIHNRDVPRSWHDQTMWQAMKVCREPLIKRIPVYAIVRAAGWAALRRERAR